MTSKPPNTILADEDDDYNSSEDEDFNPDQQPAQNEDDISSSSSDEEDGDSKKPAGSKKPKRKRKDAVSVKDELDEENSGDEAVIRSVKSKRTKVKDEYEDDEGGEGGLIKTRAQRAREIQAKAPLATTDSATIDVDDFWKTLNAPSPPRTSSTPSSVPASTIQTITTSRIEPALPIPTTEKLPHDVGIQVATAEAMTAIPLPVPLGSATAAALMEGVETRTETTATIPAEADGMVTIKRTYEFAGETITEEKQVPAGSFEARAYLDSLKEISNAPAGGKPNPTKPPLRRPMKKASKFDLSGGGAKAKKLNTLEKSKLDWAGFVDKEGIGDDLDRQRKQGGDSYLERQDFLGRVGHRTGERR